MARIRMCASTEKTFADGFEEYIFDMKSRNLRQGTIKHYQESIQQIYKRIPQDTPISSFNADTVPSFIVALKDSENLNDVSIGTYSRDLKTLLRFFMDKEYIPYFKISLPKADKQPIETYTDAELKKDTEHRTELKKLMEYVREGDTVIVDSFSRFARNTKDLLNLVEQLQNKGVSFISLKENIDTTTPQGKFMLTVFAGLAQFEREQTLERQREGITIAKEQGKYKGRQRIVYDKNLFSSLVDKVKAGEMTARKAMEELNMKPNTFYRRVKEMEQKGNMA